MMAELLPWLIAIFGAAIAWQLRVLRDKLYNL